MHEPGKNASYVLVDSGDQLLVHPIQAIIHQLIDPVLIKFTGGSDGG
jgi:hypothetical protein